VAQLLALLKIRKVLSEAAGVRHRALLAVLDRINSCRFCLTSRHIGVALRCSGREMRIVDIGTLIGQAQVIPAGEGQWIVNHRVDLETFNERYYIILYYWIVHTAEVKLDA